MPGRIVKLRWGFPTGKVAWRKPALSCSNQASHRKRLYAVIGVTNWKGSRVERRLIILFESGKLLQRTIQHFKCPKLGKIFNHACRSHNIQFTSQFFTTQFILDFYFIVHLNRDFAFLCFIDK